MSKAHTRRCVAVTTIALAVALAPAGCKKDKSDKAQIEGVLDAIEQGLETGKQSEVLAHIDDAYKDARGDRKALGQYLFILSRRGDITILRNQQDIAVTGNTATATIRALVMQGSGTLIPERADEFNLKVMLMKDGEWRVVRVDREPSTP